MKVIRTNRLTLRPLKPTDWPQIQFLRSDKNVNKYVNRPPAPTQEAAMAFISKISGGVKASLFYFWAICEKDNDALIGTICLWNFSKDRKTAETGYDLDPKAQGGGIMTESLQAIITFGFQTLKLNTIEAYTHYGNQASINLLSTCDFILQPEMTDDDNTNNIVFSLLKQSV